MAALFPLDMPTNIGIASIELRAKNTTAMSLSPFTYKQQIHQYSGQMWEADIDLPPMNRDDAEAWVAFLLRLQGRVGSFLLGDPAAKTPRGTARSGDLTFNGNFNGTVYADIPLGDTLKAGDYIQIGSSATASLHKVLADFTGTGSNEELEIWPKPRAAKTSVAMTFLDAKGNFRLNTNEVSWSVNNASFYGISFGAMEVL